MLNGINLIRALSCTAIALFHIAEHVNSTYSGVYVPFKGAAAGFHLFLAISGFILVYITRPDDKPYRFMMKRVIRITPIYWLMTGVLIALALIKPWMFPRADISLEGVLTSLFYIPSYNEWDKLQPVLFVGWTLNYMMLFYALFSLSLLVPQRWQIPGVIAALLAVMLGGHFLLPENAAGVFYSDPILLEFAAGCLVGLALKNEAVIAWIKRTPMWPLMLAAGAGLTAASFVETNGLLTVAMFAPASSLMIFAVAGKDLYRKPLKSSILARLGLISYGVYLIHPLLIPPLGMFVRDHVSGGYAGVALLYVSVMGLTLILADLTYRWVEKPSNSWLRKVFGLNSKLAKKKSPAESGLSAAAASR